jgi:hypothetical protein
MALAVRAPAERYGVASQKIYLRAVSARRDERRGRIGTQRIELIAHFHPYGRRDRLRRNRSISRSQRPIGDGVR